MKHFSPLFGSLLFSTFCFLFIFSPFVSAATTESSFTSLSPTVRVISYNLTQGFQVSPSVFGSGTIISNDGLVLTNSHVVMDEFDDPYEAFAICVVTQREKQPDCLYLGTLLAFDKRLDLALLRIQPLPIFDMDMPALPSLPLRNTVEELQENEEITILGFPSAGGKTITRTKGLISGFEEKEQVRLLKTDADINPGNSGGTVLNAEGEFAGIPSAVRTDVSGIGLIIPIDEAAAWVDSLAIDVIGEADDDVRNLMVRELRRQYRFNHERLYESSQFPGFSVSLPDDWTLYSDSVSSSLFFRSVLSKPTVIYFQAFSSAYPVRDEDIEFIVRKGDLKQEQRVGYARKTVLFHDIESQSISWKDGDQQTVTLLVPVENSLLLVSYNLSLDLLEDTQNAIDEVLDSFTFMETSTDIPVYLQEYTHIKPHLQIETPGNQYINPIIPVDQKDVVLYIEHPDSLEQEFVLSYIRIPKDYRSLSISEILDEVVKDLDGDIISRSTDVVLDGLPGYAYTFGFKGDDASQLKKRSVVTGFTDTHFFEFRYENTEEEFDSRIDEVKTILGSFATSEGDTSRDHASVLPQLNQLYDDIQNHLYEEEINALVSRGIGFLASSEFLPEEAMGRLDALRAIVQSKIFVEEGRNDTTTEKSLLGYTSKRIFSDVRDREERRLLHFAIDQDLVTRRIDFRAHEGVELVEAMRMLCQLYSLPVWTPPYEEGHLMPWFVPYYMKAIELGLVPRDVEYNTRLTRAQFMRMLYLFIRNVGERYDI
jgi:hypothetical protein